MNVNRDIKKIDKIIVHCSDSDVPDHDNIETVRKWHLDKKWTDIGYHFFINKKGEVFTGRDIKVAGAHCRKQNLSSIGICVSGRKEFNDKQFSALYFLVKNLMETYKIKRTEVYPHNYFSPIKTCPNFPMWKFWKFDYK
jgi:N-acetyl-anhydromuramyl-L-alanine amidase AmpD